MIGHTQLNAKSQFRPGESFKSLRCLPIRAAPQGKTVDRGFGILEWTGKVVPQGLFVSGQVLVLFH
jgi:hypothetical protein